MSVSTNSVLVLGVVAAFPAMSSHGLADPSESQTRAAIHQAVGFFRQQASAGGGYIYRLSEDLSLREGEGVVGTTTAWIQPPATPSVGMAYLHAFRLTEDPLLLEAAVETGLALVRGQLDSGGWGNQIEFGREDRKRYSYRIDGNPERRSYTTFDDDKSQSALRFLMQLDRELGGSDERIADAVRYAQEAFLGAQYPNGAWPQQYREPADKEEFPVLQASYPDKWSRTFPGRSYRGFYTLNDGTISDLVETMLVAYDLYGDRRFLAAALKGGDFFLLAQMPDPQPGWCQQYDRQMHPAWARKFEPPALTGGESQGVIQTLMTLYERSGNGKYLEPLSRAFEYYRSSLLPDGRLARFYELKTNRPLYFTTDYELTYRDDDLPTHYGFQVSSRLDRLERQYRQLARTPVEKLNPSITSVKADIPRLRNSLADSAGRVISQLDERGAWVEEGRLRYHDVDDVTRVISSDTFIRNLTTLAEYVAALRASES